MKITLKLWFILLLVINIAFATVNINTATIEELQKVKGIGPAKAQAIVEYRNTHGAFQSTNELIKIKGFGTKSVAKLESQLDIK